MKKRIEIISLVIVFLSYFSFNANLYWLLVKKTGIGVAYVLDQFSPLLISVSIVLWFFKRKIKKDFLLPVLKKHGLSFLLILSIILIVHGWITEFYFFGEEPTSILAEVITPGSEKLVNILRGYHWGTYVLSYLLFGTHAWMYNIFTLFLFILVSFALYLFLYIIFKKKSPALFGTLFFITTPAYLDTFNWQANASGMSLVLLVSIVSLIFLLYFQKTKKSIYYLLALLFFVSMLKISFVRTFGFITLPVYIFFFPLSGKKSSFSKAFIASMPFVATWLIFFTIQFLIPINFFEKLLTLVAHHQKSVEETLHIRVRSNPVQTDNYFFALGTFFAYLFIPTQLAAQIFPIIKSQFQVATNGFNLSITAITGVFLELAILFFSIFSFIKWKGFLRWIIFFAVIAMLANMFYIPFFISEYHSLSTLDSVFIRNDAGNGPGSRYVFISSFGVAILVGTYAYGLLKQEKKYTGLFLYGLIGIIIFQSFLSIQNHREALHNLQTQKILPDHIFAMLPQDGKKKIIFSTNPLKNNIELKIGGAKWLNAFYTDKELIYVNTYEDFFNVLKKTKYKKENIYAFYNNPATYIFADVSRLVRSELIDHHTQKNINLQSGTKSFSSQIIKSSISKYPFLLQRGTFISHDLYARFLLPGKVTFSLEKQQNTVEFPYVDAMVFNSFSKNQFPLSLWKIAEKRPIIADENGLLKKLQVQTFSNVPVQSISSFDRQAIINILKDREQLRLQTQLTVSDIATYDNKIKKTSLMDNIFTTNPLQDKDTYFLAKSTPTIFTFHFPYAITVGRILFNVLPGSYMNMPTEFTIYSSADSNEIIGNQKSVVPATWSPNGGNLYDISVIPTRTDSLRLEIKKTIHNPIVLDEIIIDNTNAVSYSPDKIYELGNKVQYYIDSQDILQNLLFMKEFNSLTAFYACAENTDWEKQKQDMSKMIPGIWKASQIPLSSGADTEDLSFPVDCSGSVLRKIILVAPGYPGKFTVNSIVLE